MSIKRVNAVRYRSSMDPRQFYDFETAVRAEAAVIIIEKHGTDGWHHLKATQKSRAKKMHRRLCRLIRKAQG